MRLGLGCRFRSVDRIRMGDVMLDGNRDFASFPDETQPPCAPNPSPTALTPALRAALADLEHALRRFLDDTNEPASNASRDGGRP
jgi:hypothetical protein